MKHETVVAILAAITGLIFGFEFGWCAHRYHTNPATNTGINHERNAKQDATEGVEGANKVLRQQRAALE